MRIGNYRPERNGRTFYFFPYFNLHKDYICHAIKRQALLQSPAFSGSLFNFGLATSYLIDIGKTARILETSIDKDPLDSSISFYLKCLADSVKSLKRFSNIDKILKREAHLQFQVLSPIENLLLEDLYNFCSLAEGVISRFSFYRDTLNLKKDPSIKLKIKHCNNFLGFARLQERITDLFDSKVFGSLLLPQNTRKEARG